MKCIKCGQPAVINMRQHRLGLCAEHFLEWVPLQVERAIEKYEMFAPGERVLVAVSGGKDSLSLWDILLRLGYPAEGLYINLGVPHLNYSDVSQQKVEQFAAEHGATYHVVNVQSEYGQTIPEVARRKRGRSPCSTCGLIKRHILNQVARDGGYAVLATGHNVDDEAAVLFQNTLHWATGYLARQAPALPASHPGLVRKVKPLIRLYEREMAAYALVRGIDYIYEECPYSRGATTLFYKVLLNQLEEASPGAKQSFYLSFLQARAEGRLLPEAAGAVEMHACLRCGQPTTAPDLCAFCRLWDQGEVNHGPAQSTGCPAGRDRNSSEDTENTE
jgi:uncharacterized protein (TIGR00269 family)